jgi:hypothetical protein
MKSKFTILFSLFALAAMNMAAQAAATVSGTSVTVTGDSDVLNLGQGTVFAESIGQLWNGGAYWNPNAPASVTANGVAFIDPYQVNPPNSPWVQNGVTLSISQFSDLDSNGEVGSVTGNIKSLLFGDVMVSDNSEGGNNGQYAPPGDNSISLSGLTAGQAYTLQIFAGQNFENGNELVTDGTSSGILSYNSSDASILDAFTPTGTTETIDLTPLAAPGSYFMPGTDISAVNLQLGDVPEPSTYAMLALGLVGLIAWQRKRAALRI